MNATVIQLPAAAAIDASDKFLEELSDIYLWDLPSDVPRGVRNGWCNLGSAKNIRLSETPIEPWAQGLLSLIQEQYPTGEDDFAIEYTNMRFRGHRDSTVGGNLLAMRRQTMAVPRLDELLLPAWWVPLLMQKSLLKEGGLIVMAAALGCGKSTTIASLIRTRLEAYGGHARTVEDPCELPLDGFWGDGVCVQCPVDPKVEPKIGWSTALRKMLRAYPASTEGGQILFIGEIRGSDVAAEAVRAAVNGQLVITTIHASSVVTAIKRLVAFAAEDMGHEVARDMVSSALRLVFTQNLRRNPNPSATGWQRRIIEGSVLASGGDGHPVGVNIREGKFNMLNQSFDRLKKLMTTMKPADTPVEELLRESAKA
ncbi:MAG: ATPase, T2SS/T4P/T4SS family [Dokdonella sp.]